MTNVSDDDSTEDLKDGVVARVPMMFMDRQTVLADGLPGGLHRPGYRYCSESRRRAPRGTRCTIATMPSWCRDGRGARNV